MIKNIIFDVGGVLITGTFAGYPALLSKITGISVADASKEWSTHKSDLLIGNITSEAFFKKILSKYPSTKQLTNLLNEWIDGYIAHKKEDLNSELLDFINTITTKYNLYAFSDCLDIDDQDSIVQQNVYPLFQKVVLSTKEHLEKSNPLSYDNLITTLNIHPAESLFIDDKASNVEMARDKDIQSVRFTSNKLLFQELHELEVI